MAVVAGHDAGGVEVLDGECKGALYQDVAAGTISAVQSDLVTSQAKR